MSGNTSLMARFATLEAQIEAIETQLSFATLEAQATETRLRDIATGIAELQRDDMTSRRVTAFSSVFKLCAQKVAPWTTRLYHHPPSDNDSYLKYGKRFISSHFAWRRFSRTRPMARQTFTVQNLEKFVRQIPPGGYYHNYGRSGPDTIGLVVEVMMVLGDYEKLNGTSPDMRLVLEFLLCLMGPVEASKAVEYVLECIQEEFWEVSQSIIDHAHPFTLVH